MSLLMRTERGDFYSNVLNPRCRNQFWRFDMMFMRERSHEGSLSEAATGISLWDGQSERIFADLVGDNENQYLMTDSTIVRGHQQAATGHKKGLRRQGFGAFPGWIEHQGPSAG
jgi:hypothetical protein